MFFGCGEGRGTHGIEWAHPKNVANCGQKEKNCEWKLMMKDALKLLERQRRVAQKIQ